MTRLLTSDVELKPGMTIEYLHSKGKFKGKLVERSPLGDSWFLESGLEMKFMTESWTSKILLPFVLIYQHFEPVIGVRSVHVSE